MKYISRCLRAELIRIKSTPVLWLTICSAGLLPFAYLLGGIFNTKKMIPGPGINPWDILLKREWNDLSGMLLPLFIILCAALLIQIEYKANAWKQLLTQPVPEWAVYTGKLIMLVLIVGACFMLFILFSLLSGVLAGLIKPSLQFLNYPPSWHFLTRAAIHTVAAILGLLGIQYVLSLCFRNFIVPSGIGLAGFIVSFFVYRTDYYDFYPYGSAMITSTGLNAPTPPAFFILNEWVSITWFVLVTTGGYFIFLNRMKKTA